MNQIRGIEGVYGRMPIGATLSMSRRLKPRGMPAEKYGWHILDAREYDGLKHHHSRFDFFNQAEWKKRQTVQGVLVHSTESECFEWHRKAQIIKKPAHPQGRPHCIGDGVKAVRWSFDEPGEFFDIECLGKKCEFAQGRPPPCLPWFRFVFLLTWSNPDLPVILVQLSSKSWNSLQNIVGFFGYVRSTADGMGLQNYSLMGYPFTLQHTYQTNKEEQTRYQVIRITPLIEPAEFFSRQSSQIKQIQSDYGKCEALTDQSQQDPSVIFEQYKDVSVDWGEKSSNRQTPEV